MKQTHRALRGAAKERAFLKKCAERDARMRHLQNIIDGIEHCDSPRTNADRDALREAQTELAKLRSET